MTAKIKDFREILIPHSDCGHEREYAEMMAEKLRAYTDADKVTVDPMNNVIAYIGDPDKYTIMLEAHIDEISLIVHDITEDGFLRVKNVGGVDRRTLPSSEVLVNGLPGIVCNTPPHLSTDPRKVPEYEDLYIDLGLSADEVKKLVKIGDRVYSTAGIVELQNGRVAARAHDDRICAYSILTALKKLSTYIKNGSLDCCIAVLFATQEELGSRGAKVGTYTIDPDEALVLDVTLAAEQGVKSSIKVGEGPVIERSGYFDRQMIRDLCNIAKEKNIKYQNDVSVRSGGTDAAAVHMTCAYVSTVLISLPLRHMHTPYEVIDIADVESTASLMAEYIKFKFKKSAKSKKEGK